MRPHLAKLSGASRESQQSRTRQHPLIYGIRDPIDLHLILLALPHLPHRHDQHQFLKMVGAGIQEVCIGRVTLIDDACLPHPPLDHISSSFRHSRLSQVNR